MEFMCPTCGMKDVVIGDRTPRCLACGTILIKATGGYVDLMMSPNFAISRFEKVIAKYGSKESLSGRFKKEREAWITSVWALGLREITNQRYWIEIETRELTPDCKVHQIDQSSGNNHILTRHVEVVEWEQHRNEVVDVIIQKCAKAYPQYFTLLVFARNGKEIRVPDLLQEMQALTVPFWEIWLLGRVSATAARYLVCMLHPHLETEEFDLCEVVAKNQGQVDFLRRQKRGKGTVMKDLGFVYLPLP